MTAEEVLRGRPDSSFTLNVGDFWVGDGCRLTGGDGHWAREGDRYLMFLVPDDFRSSQYRLANWGGGALRLTGNWVSGGLPTLNDVRALAKAGIGMEPPPPNSNRLRDGVLIPAFLDQLNREHESQAERPVGTGAVESSADAGQTTGREAWLAIAVGAVTAAGVLILAGRTRVR